ncbi:uncharacterized protein LOC144479173 [Mustelus asterias]
MGNASSGNNNSVNHSSPTADPKIRSIKTNLATQAGDIPAYIYVKNDTKTVKLTDPQLFIVTGKAMSPLEPVEMGEEKKIAFTENPDGGCAGLISYQCGDKQLVVLFYKPSTLSDSDLPVCALSIRESKITLDGSLYQAMLQEKESDGLFNKKSISEMEHLQVLEAKGLKVTVMLEDPASIGVTVTNMKSK